MKVKINNKTVDGVAGTGIGCAILFLVGAIFLLLGLFFLSPLLIPLILGILIGRFH